MTYEDVVAVLSLVPEAVGICHQQKGRPYAGDERHRASLAKLLKRDEVYSVVRVMRRLHGEHPIWCLFRADGGHRAVRPVRPGTVETLLAIETSLFAPFVKGEPRRMSESAFLSCTDTGNRRPNLVDYVEGLL